MPAILDGLSYDGNLVRHAGVAGLKPSAPACEHHSPHAAANEEASAAEQEEGPAPSKPTNDCQCRHRGGAPGGRPVWAPGAGRWELSSSHALVLAHASTQTPPGGRDNKRRRCRARAAAMLRRRLRTRRRSGECPCRRRAGTRGSSSVQHFDNHELIAFEQLERHGAAAGPAVLVEVVLEHVDVERPRPPRVSLHLFGLCTSSQRR